MIAILKPFLVNLAQEHLEAGLPMLQSDEYAVTHWVGTYAMYALTRSINSQPDVA